MRRAGRRTLLSAMPPTTACSRAAARRSTAAPPTRCSDVDAEPEAITHHFTEAGLDDAAIGWWGKAADQALRRSAFQEAIAHLGKAIASDTAGATAFRDVEDLLAEREGGAFVLNLQQWYIL